MVINDQYVYDGLFIHNRFAYKYFKENVNPSGDIVIFRAPMNVTDNLIDLEDSLQHDFIYSDDALNFCWEIPNLGPLGAVAFQRLFNTYIANALHSIINQPVEIDGDDIMVHVEQEVKNAETGKEEIQKIKKKASVSITYSKDNIAIGHTGINIDTGKFAPNFAFSTKMNDEQIKELCINIVHGFYNLTHDLFIATTKVIV